MVVGNPNENYGKELILDIHFCNPETFTKERLDEFFKAVCERTGMKRCERHFWGYEDKFEYANAPDHLKGLSAIQFITTSNITIHTLDVLKRVYVNFFSCKDFKSETVITLAKHCFGGQVVNAREAIRR